VGAKRNKEVTVKEAAGVAKKGVYGRARKK